MVTAGQAEARPYEDWVEQELDDAAVAFVALEDGRVTGYATLQSLGDDPTRLEHGFTGVLPECRRRGIATALGDAQIAWAAARGYEELFTTHGRDEHRVASPEGEARVRRGSGADPRARAGMSVVAPPRWEVVYAEAHAERFRYLAGSGAEFLRRPGVLAVRTGADSNVDNGIVLEREDADIEGLIDWFRRACVAHLLGVRGSRRAARAPRGARCARGDDRGHDGGRARRPAARSRLRPASRSRRTTSREPLPIRHWVARRDGRRVGDASAFFTSSTVLLEHVEVAEEERRRGNRHGACAGPAPRGSPPGLRAGRLRNDSRKRGAVRAVRFHHAAGRGPPLVLPPARAVTTDHFAGRVAERYDERRRRCSRPDVLDPAVDFLAELAGGGAGARARNRDRPGCAAARAARHPRSPVSTSRPTWSRSCGRSPAAEDIR